ncbi:GntR family transcriptional regulator [Ideonella sp. 4Y11]|uniref:GntR family transcriptional regulator n=1 Tax=Ideonella aquatica TaxID=2824119 RepID=A0A940YIS8_9BURK|nr:GntR family transcriptional regulator [Ideonella aquatica]MBQ0957832.1 GntR family transcriptional regulator [Ideonella aquatica]
MAPRQGTEARRPARSTAGTPAPQPVSAEASRPDAIADRIVDAILAGRLAPGQRLGEQALADLFGCSRTLVREAMARLSARGMVEVNARRGWFVVQPSLDEAREAFGARLALETGLLHGLEGPLPKPALRQLKDHVARERSAIRAGDPGERSWLLGDFHVCLAECAGNGLLADIVKDLTARTTLIATLYQSTHAASESCAEHAQIVAALEAGDLPGAIALLRAHIGSVARHLGQDAATDDPLAPLRTALALQPDTPPPPARPRRRRALFTDLVPPVPPRPES